MITQEWALKAQEWASITHDCITQHGKEKTMKIKLMTQVREQTNKYRKGMCITPS